MRSSPGCWQLFGEIIEATFSVGRSPAEQPHMDCFAVQHPGGAESDRRQQGSVAVHLICLCLRIEHHLPVTQLAALRSHISQNALPRLDLSGIPYLPPPDPAPAR
jgi:hypothetical protein